MIYPDPYYVLSQTLRNRKCPAPQLEIAAAAWRAKCEMIAQRWGKRQFMDEMTALCELFEDKYGAITPGGLRTPAHSDIFDVMDAG